MTPDDMARLHALGFTLPPPWSAGDFAALLEQPGVFAVTEPGAFALGRVAADEAELLTLVVAPNQRRAGLARRLVARFLARAAQDGAQTCFLEVATGNAPALALYAACGFDTVGRRPRYYLAQGQPPQDALVLMRKLPAEGQTG